MLKLNLIKFLLITLIAITGTNNLNSASASYSSEKLNNQSKVNHDNLIVKKSGGRSSGGSFKRKPSRSIKKSPRRSNNQRKSTSPHLNYQRQKSNSPRYRRRPSTPTYYRSSSRSNRSGLGLSNFIFILIFLGGLIVILFYIFNRIFNSNSSGSSKTDRKIAQERDNDRITISLVQVALSFSAQEIQADLTELSQTVDTSIDEELVELLQESALILLRSDLHWTHALSKSYSLNIAQAEEKFEQLSLIERSKFSNESLSNVDGKIKIKESQNQSADEFAAYVVVTLIVGTANDSALFDQVHNLESLKQALIQLSSLREDYLMKVELLWTPQQQNQYLTDEELLLEYPDIMPL